MQDDPDLQDESCLTDGQPPQWIADLAALRDCRTQQELLPLRMGDLFNELKTRWDKEMRQLAREAGVPYEQARQRARIAARIPPGSRLRSLGLPFSILRLLASVADPDPWAEKALALDAEKKLQVRDFARLLEEGGARPARPPKVIRCARCDRPVGDGPQRVFFRRGDASGWLCTTGCALGFFSLPPPPPPAPKSEPPPTAAPQDTPVPTPPAESAAARSAGLPTGVADLKVGAALGSATGIVPQSTSQRDSESQAPHAAHAEPNRSRAPPRVPCRWISP